MCLVKNVFGRSRGGHGRMPSKKYATDLPRASIKIESEALVSTSDFRPVLTKSTVSCRARYDTSMILSPAPATQWNLTSKQIDVHFSDLPPEYLIRFKTLQAKQVRLFSPAVPPARVSSHPPARKKRGRKKERGGLGATWGETFVGRGAPAVTYWYFSFCPFLAKDTNVVSWKI